MREATIVADAVNAARDLQNAPPNEMAPRHVADAARALGAIDGRDGRRSRGARACSQRGMGSFAAVAQGADEEPALITLNYDGPDATGPVLGLVGKAVTFDTGGISIKPANKMSEMKFDMSGGAAVLGAVEAIARLRAAGAASWPSSARRRTCRRATRCGPATSSPRPTA